MFRRVARARGDTETEAAQLVARVQWIPNQPFTDFVEIAVNAGVAPAAAFAARPPLHLAQVVGEQAPPVHRPEISGRPSAL